jgi:hypothetical protein
MTIPQKKKKKKTEEAPRKWKLDQKFDMGASLPFLRRDQIHHLRKHGDFLILRKGLFRRDVLRAVGSTVIGLVCSIGLFLVLAVAVAGLFIALTALLSGPNLKALFDESNLWKHIADSDTWHGWGWVLSLLGPSWWVFTIPFAIGVLLAGILWFPTALAKFLHGRARSGETAQEHSQRRRLRWFAALLCVTGVASSLIIVWRNKLGIGASNAGDQGSLAGLAMPLAFFLGASLITLFLYVLVGARWTRWWTKDLRSLFGAMHGICICGLLGSVLLVALVFLAWWLRDLSYGGSGVAGGGIVSLVLSRLLALRGQAAADAVALGRRILAAAPMVVLNIAVVVLLLTVLLGCADVLVTMGVTQWWIGLAVFVCASAAVAILGCLIDFNRISPHYFYRDRLAEAYLQTELHEEGGLQIVRCDCSQPLRTLHDRDDGEENDRDDGEETKEKNDKNRKSKPLGPYHLILCALNLAGSRDLARKDRKSDHFIFSRAYCGSSTTGYIATGDYRRGKTKLCTAMTISGAAVSSAMGFYTSFAQAFATTLFNIRLGYWLINPRIYHTGKHQDDDPKKEEKVVYPNGREPKPWASDSWHRRPLVWLAKRYREKAVFWPKYLSHELRAATNAQHWLVNLSDGGHTGDNLGLYPLLQRRCRLIIACDGECDSDYNFDSLARAIRQIYTDENVEIDVDLRKIRPWRKGRHPRAHYVIGRIRYPNCLDDLGLDKPKFKNPDAEFESGYKADFGWIIYLKSSLMMGREPATVQAYAARHDKFPHQSTADQFFDDDQFDAYRALGYYIAESMLGDAKKVADVPTTLKLMKWCEGQWNRSSR